MLLKTMKLTESIAGRLVAFGVLFAAASFVTDVSAQTQPGRAEVRAVRGSAVYSTATEPAVPLKVGAVIPPGATVKTAADSTVDLFMGNSAGVLRVNENTTVTIDKFTITETGADTVVDVQLNLPDGTILGNVNKLAAASKYEIKVPNGVAGIRGTRFRISSTSFIVLLDGRLVFVHVPPGGQPTPYTLNAPPPVYFSPIEGVKPAPEDLAKEVYQQFAGGPPGKPGLLPPLGIPPVEGFIRPGTGQQEDQFIYQAK